MTSQQVGKLLYIAMAVFHFIASIMFYFESNALASIVQLIGSVFWLSVMYADPQLN